MPVWTGKYRTPKTLSSSCFMQTSGKGNKGIVLLPHLERPEQNSPSAEELWSRASPRGSGNDLCRPRGAKWCSRDTGNARGGAAPGTDVTGKVIWTQTQGQNNWARCIPQNLTCYRYNGVQSHHPEEEMHFPGERVAKITHITKTTQCSAGEWETPNWKPEDFTPCFRSCFPTETMIFEGRRYLLEKCSFWMRLIFLWGWFW